MMIIIWILIMLVLYHVLSSPRRTNDGYKQGSTAEEALKIRYANGEIDDETYKKMKKNIR